MNDFATIRLPRMTAQQVRLALDTFAGELMKLHPGEQDAFNVAYQLRGVSDSILLELVKEEVKPNVE